MKHRKKPAQLSYNIKQLPPELQNYFFIRWGVSAIFLITVIVIFLLAGLHKALLMVSLGILLYMGYVTYECIRVLSGSLIMLQGVCESRRDDYFKVSNPIFKKSSFMNMFEYYGKSTLTIATDNLKFTVPVGHIFSVKNGQTVRVYTFPDEVYPSADNAFQINNPLLTKVVKI